MTQKIVVLEGSSFTTQAAQSFETEEAASKFILGRVAALVSGGNKARHDSALRERIVSEDGQKATSEVVEGALAFATAMAKAFAPSVTVVRKRAVKEDDDQQ
jgi:hypothetical protein